MSLQRGAYGIEYHTREAHSPLRWIVPLVIVVVIVALFTARGCMKRMPKPARGVARVPPPKEMPVLRDVTPVTQAVNAPVAKPAAAPAPKAVGKQVADPAAIVAPTAQTVAAQPDDVRALLEKVVEAERADDLLAFRTALLALRAHPKATTMRAYAEKQLGVVNMRLVMGDMAMPGKTRVRVANGDTAAGIAKRYSVTTAYVLRANGIRDPRAIRVGRELWVLNRPVFALEFSRHDASAVLMMNGDFFKRYRADIAETVATGQMTLREALAGGRIRMTAADKEELGLFVLMRGKVTVRE